MSAESVPDMVSEYRGQHSMPEMTIFGYVIALLLVPVLLPLLPFLAIYWAYGSLRDRLAGPGEAQ